MRHLRLASFLLVAAGCASNGPSVIVDVVTDFAPGTEFQAVRTRIVDGPEEVTPATEGESSSYLRARRVASFSGELSAGDFTVQVELLRPDGSVLAAQTRTGTLSGTLAITAVFTRNCRAVECGIGQVCIDETCVDGTCDPSDPASCPDAVLCQTDNDCIGAGLADCAEASCIRFLCLAEADSSMCEAGLYCNAEAGCVPPPTGECGASCGGDGACRIGILDCSSGSPVCIESDVDTGTPCSQAGETGSCDGLGTCVVGCVDGAPCARERRCEAGITRCMGGVAVCEGNGAADAGTTCREAAGPCDLEEQCDGIGMECPDDSGAFDVVCRASDGPCDVEEVCDGTSAACPTDRFASVGSACTDGFCDGLVAGCQDGCLPGAPCSTGNPCVAGALDCSGATPTCLAAADLTNGTSCGDTVFSTWGPCGGFTGTCGNAGQRTRTETYSECQSGTCTSREVVGNEACVRNTNGQTCSPTSCGGYSACGGFVDRCDLGGTQSRTCTDYACAGGSCGSSGRVENQSCSRTLSETCGDLIDTDCDGTCDEGCRVPIHRGRRGNDHFYTRTLSELTGAGYAYEGIEFYLYPGSHAGLARLFRCRVGSDHFVTLNSTCEGRTVEGVLGYARQPTQPSCGSVPLYRLNWSAGGDHFYTTSAAERASAIPPYVSEGTAAHVWTTP